MFSLIVLWMCRLSYNTWRRGLFNLSDEDYRWPILRAKMHPIIFQIFNLGFIVIIQNALLLLLGLPLRMAVNQPHTPLQTSDYLMGALALTLLGLEFVADNQQYAFHAYKHAVKAKEAGDASAPAYNPAEHWPGSRLDWTEGDARRGFVTRGLWKYSRHPNFFCEQSFWWVITLFPLVAPASQSFSSIPELPSLDTVLVSLAYPPAWPMLADVFWTALSPLLTEISPAVGLTVLFYASSTFSESISVMKYPAAYPAYQARVGRFAPTATLCKWARLTLFGSQQEEKRIDMVLWGGDSEHDKSK